MQEKRKSSKRDEEVAELPFQILIQQTQQERILIQVAISFGDDHKQTVVTAS
jgi:hypothetical protein